MKISKSTIDVLKNFSNINNSLLVRPGNTLTVRNLAGDVQAAAVVEEDFPMEFGINDVKKLIQLISLFKDHDVEFSENYLTIKSAASSVRVVHGLAEAIITTRKAVFPVAPPNPIAMVQFSTDQLEAVLSGANILGIQVVSFKGADGVFKIVAEDVKNSANNYEETVCKIVDGLDFSFNYKTDVLRFLPGTYEAYFVKAGDSLQSLFRNASQGYAIGPDFTSYSR